VDVGTAVLLSIPCALAGWTCWRQPPACRSWLGRWGVWLLGWYLAVHAPVATALCRDASPCADAVLLRDMLHPSPGDQHTGGIWERGAVLGCCCVTGGD